MSTTIEQNVVEFQFDNKQFERNVSTTMSSLDKLKEKLNFTGASKGLEDVGAAAKNINMNGLGTAVEQVSMRFSALQVMGVTALANITNSAVNAGKRIVSALTIDPIKTGFQEYETQINSVQTILANTSSKGTTIDDVNKALEELNKYADMTIYNFTEMTRNIGTFTAAGIDLDTSVNAIQGIANLAAVSGSTSQQASTAMYQLSQALASGTVKLMDWNSVVNAGMGGEVFQNALKETSEALGTGAEAAIKAGGSFRESLSQGWLTAEVLTETLKKFTTSGATEYVAEYAGITAEAVTAELELAEAQYGETEAIKEASKALAEKTGKNADEIASILEFAKTATDAATKVKTFTQLWDVLKEAAQSGWSQTWKLIIGDFEQAKSLLTPLADFLTGIINTMSDFRNDVLESALGKTFTSLADKVSGVTESTTAAVEAITDLGDVVNRVISGEFGSGAARIDALTEAGFNYYKVQNKVNEALGASKRYSEDQIKAQDEVVGLTTEQTTAVADLNTEQKDHLKTLIRMADAGQTISGYSEDQVTALKSLAKQAKKTGLSIDDFVDNLDQINGRWLMIEGIKNIGKILVDTFNALKTAWQNVFPPKTIEERAEKVFDLLAAFHKFTVGIRDAVYANDEFTETGDKLRRTFEGIFAVVKTVTTILSGGFKMAVKVVSTVLRNFNLNVLDITAVVGDAFVRMYDTVSTVVDMISTFVADHITAWIEKFQESEMITTIADWFKSASDTISEVISNISSEFDGFTTSGFVTKLQGVYDFFAGVGKSLRGSEVVVSMVELLKKGFSNLKNLLPKIEIPKFNLDNYKWYTNLLERLDGFNFSSIQGVFSSLVGWLKSSTITKMKTQFKNLAGIDWDTFKLNALSSLASFWLSISDKVTAAIEKCKEIFQSIVKFVFGTENVDLPTILDLASKVLGLAVLFEALKVLKSFTSPFDNITDALNNFASSIKWRAVGDAFKALALVLLAVTACIVILASMPDMNKAWNAVGMLGTLLVGMGVIVAGLMFMASKMPAGDVVDIVGVSLSMLTLIGTVWLLTEVLQKIDELKLRNPVKTFTSLGLMLLGLSAGIKIIAAAGSSSFKSVAAIITLVSAMKLILGVIEDYDKFDWKGKNKAIWHMVDMLMVLSLAINVASRGVKADGGFMGLAALLLVMVVSLKLLLGIIEDFAAMPIDTLRKGGLVVAALLGAMTLMMFALGKANKGAVLEKGQKSVNNFVGMATALLAVVGAIWILGKTPVDVLTRGGLAVAGILIMFTTMLTSIGKACGGLKMPSIIAMLTGIGLIVAEVFVLIRLMEGVPWQQALGSAAALSLVLASMAVVLRILSASKCDGTNILKWIGAMAGLSLVMYALAGIVKSMKDVPWRDSVGNVVAMGLMLIAMSSALVILNNIPVNGVNLIKSLGALVGVFVVVAGLSLILANMSGVENAIANATALSILALALSICTPILAAAGAVAPSAVVGVTALVALAVVLGVLVLALSHIPNTDAARQNAITLSGLAVVLSLCTIPLAAAGLVAPIATVGATLLITLAVVLGLLVAALSRITDTDTARQNAITLSNLAIVLSLCTLPLALASILAPAATVGAVLLVTLATTLGVLVYSLSKIKDTEQARGNADIMIDIITSLTEMIVKIGALGKDAIYAVDALSGLISLVKKLEDFARKMGKLSENNPELERFIDTGLELFKKLGRGLGEVLSEFGAGLVSSLPEIGSKLSEFGENMVGFVEIMQVTTDDIIDRAKMLAEAISALVKSDVINSLSEDFGGSLPEMGTNLSKFTENLSGFLTIMADVKPETLDGVNMLCSALQALTDANLSNAWAQILPGDQSLTTFGKSINDFAGSIKGAADALKDITDEDVQNITRSATAGEALADLAMSIPSRDGFLQDWIGEKDLAIFGETAVAFGKCLVDYSRVITSRTVDSDAISASATAGQALSDLANSLPDANGVWQEWAGEQSLAAFGDTLVEFANGLVGYSEVISGANIDADAISNSASAVSALVEVAESLPETGGKWQEWFGEQNLASFGSQLTAFASGLVNYTNIASTIDDAKIKAIENSGTAVEKLVDVVGLVPTEGSVFDMLFGSSGQSGQTFGDALSAMAIGINKFCTVAEGITSAKLEAIDAIGGEGGAIEKIKTAINAIPEGVDTNKTAVMAVAVADLAASASFIASISEAQYDYSGIDSLKTAIKSIASLISGDSALNVGNLYSAFFDLKESMTWVGVAADALASINGYTYTGIDSFKSALSSLAKADIEGVIAKFTGNAGAMSDAITELLETMTSAIYDSEDDVYDAATTLIDSALNGLITKETDFETLGDTFATKLLDGIKEKDSFARDAGESLTSEVVDGAANQDNINEMKIAGKDLGQGLVKGVEAKYQAAYDAGYELGQKAVQGEKDGQASNSPSKLTIQAGKWFGEGLIIGINKMGERVYSAGYGLGDTAVNAISSTISRIATAIDSDMDVQPTIRPVLDLSEVETGASAIGGMLSSASSVGVLSRVGAISSAMNRRGQNGGNAEVVSAIDKLYRKLDNVGNTNYNINGVTYDDGSNIAEAMRTIARVAVVERRM